ncbi:PH domain-containing protein [Catenulispora subtropica]|uniref:Low molecular weight protein antigen 6 PH domain-containing protein n=1 Tax=Catenulispora subtropica TaxID=450798 RepID=A0ABP5C6C1_9ACTN
MTTVRLAYMRRYLETLVSGLLLGLAAIPVLVYQRADFAGWLLGAVCVVALAAAVPYTYWFRADDQGLTLVRLLARRRIPWRAVQGLDLRFHRDSNTGARHAAVHIRLKPLRATRPSVARRLRPGPLIGRLSITDECPPCGTEPQALADLFAVFGDRGVPIDEREYVNAVRAAHGRPALSAPTA